MQMFQIRGPWTAVNQYVVKKHEQASSGKRLNQNLLQEVNLLVLQTDEQNCLTILPIDPSTPE